MVKKRVGGAHRYKAVHKAAGQDAQQQKQQQQQQEGPKPPSHLQRKITKSVKFYEKVLLSSAPKAPQVGASSCPMRQQLPHATAAAAAAAAGHNSCTCSPAHLVIILETV